MGRVSLLPRRHLSKTGKNEGWHVSQYAPSPACKQILFVGTPPPSLLAKNLEKASLNRRQSMRQAKV